MKILLILGLLIAISVQAQEAELDPSIFDGTGRELEKVEKINPPAGAPTSPSSETEEVPAPPGPSIASEETFEVAAEAEAPREIVLPGTEGEKPEEKPEEETGNPAAKGSGKSRAGETVDSTEKIQPGQAVDFPWDM